jgi:hypothetical protein
MNRSSRVLPSRLIKLNRFFSWILVLFAILMIISGYGITRSFFTPLSPFWFFIRDVHLWLCILFTIQFFYHIIIVEFTISSKWFTVFKKNWKTHLTPFLLIKILQKLTGYIMLIMGLLVILTGFNFYFPRIGPFFPLFQHVRFDLFFILSLILHIALGSKLVFFRKRLSNHLTDSIILGSSIIAISLLVWLNSM